MKVVLLILSLFVLFPALFAQVNAQGSPENAVECKGDIQDVKLSIDRKPLDEEASHGTTAFIVYRVDVHLVKPVKVSNGVFRLHTTSSYSEAMQSVEFWRREQIAGSPNVVFIISDKQICSDEPENKTIFQIIFGGV